MHMHAETDGAIPVHISKVTSVDINLISEHMVLAPEQF